MIRPKCLTIAILAIFLSCSGSKEVLQESKTFTYDESFNPATLNDEDIVITTDPEKTPTPQQQSQIKNSENVTEIMGYRVQIIALTDPVNASLIEQEARARFDINGYNTYYIFEAPFIKIRVGDCLDRECAEKLRELARIYYKEAQIIRTKVRVQSGTE
jgi:hypothetical protein